jgi:GNAT superfamily N-acetyltransferase
MKPEFVIEPLDKHHRREDFDCGETSLNDFLRKYARQNAERGLGRTFVAVLPDEKKVRGYYTLSSGSIAFDTVPEKLPRYPIPVAHLGRLAVDLSMRGQGLGELLLVDALERSVLIANELGIYAIELYALTEQAKQFYLKYGFVSLKDDDKHLYLPIKTIIQSGMV